MNNIRSEIQTKMRWIIAIICVLSVFGIFRPEEVKANSIYSNAYDYYNVVGNAMYFIPGADGKGEIYCATKAKKGTSDEVLYTTVGWRLTVRSADGTAVEKIYYQLGGSTMVRVDSRTIDGYEYCLYKVSFENIKNRISSYSLQVLNTPNSYISFDACTALKVNGIVQGGITDNGPAWGYVYVSYQAIASAQDWSEETKQTLLSYYNKTVSGLSHRVNVAASKGIKSATGGGSYCYGSTVTLQASAATGYKFSYWSNGAGTTNSPLISFVMGDSDVTLYAVATPLTIDVNFFEGSETSDQPTEKEKYTYDKSGQKFPNYKWRRIGYHQTGWNTEKSGEGTQYEVNNPVTNKWILDNRPSIDLYATWDINSYNIVYDSDGGTGEIPGMVAKYPDVITLATGGFEKERATLIGWSTQRDAIIPEYEFGQEVEVATLALSLGLECEHNSTITLYAVWDYAPEIVGNDVYVALEDAKKGIITETWLADYVIAEDREDGRIPYGKNPKNSFLITNYLETDFTTFKKGGYVTQNFCAIDSIGNITTKQIRVNIVDTTVYDEETLIGIPRFISSKYYKDDTGAFIKESNGGLWEDSIWRMEPAYTELLDNMFLKK